MTHLLYHLVDEVDLCGPISIKWMYLVERYMKTLKIYVCNMAKPKGSMAQRYIRYECLGFIMKYLQMFGVVQCQIWDVNEKKGNASEVFEGVGVKFIMFLTLCDVAHKYIFTNISLMSPWL